MSEKLVVEVKSDRHYTLFAEENYSDLNNAFINFQPSFDEEEKVLTALEHFVPEADFEPYFKAKENHQYDLADTELQRLYDDHIGSKSWFKRDELIDHNGLRRDVLYDTRVFDDETFLNDFINGECFVQLEVYKLGNEGILEHYDTLGGILFEGEFEELDVIEKLGEYGIADIGDQVVVLIGEEYGERPLRANFDKELGMSDVSQKVVLAKEKEIEDNVIEF